MRIRYCGADSASRIGDMDAEARGIRSVLWSTYGILPLFIHERICAQTGRVLEESIPRGSEKSEHIHGIGADEGFRQLEWTGFRRRIFRDGGVSLGWS